MSRDGYNHNLPSRFSAAPAGVQPYAAGMEEFRLRGVLS
jgi:hypothetical protein